MTLTYAEFCAGYGGLGLAVEDVFNAELSWYSEFEEAPSKIMAHHWPDAPNHGDMTLIDFTAVESVDILSGGTPCQDLSHAGRRAGMRKGTRSGLWESMREAIAIIQPRYVVWENVRGAYSAGADSEVEQCPGCMGEARDGEHFLRALGRVLGDLSDLGYDTQWCGLRAADVGAPHGRFRVFILAERRDAADADDPGRGEQWRPVPVPSQHAAIEHAGVDVAQDPNITTSSQWRIPAPGQAESGWPRPDAGRRGGAPTPDAPSIRPGHDIERGGERLPAPTGAGGTGGLEHCPTCGCRTDFHDAGGFCAGQCGGTCTDEFWGRPDTTADANGRGCEVGQELNGYPAQDPTHGNPRWGHVDGHRLEDDGPASTDWGPYAPAIHRWEQLRGPSPAPTELTAKGKHRLSARFAEWLMGLPAGWVTDIDISRNEQLKALGNGVVPQQAAAALDHMLSTQEMESAA